MFDLFNQVDPIQIRNLFSKKKTTKEKTVTTYNKMSQCSVLQWTLMSQGIGGGCLGGGAEVAGDGWLSPP